MHRFTVSTVSTVFAAVSLAAFIVPRATQPDDWPSSLESWSTYHARYISFGCDENRQTSFFADCCHPLQKNQTSADLPSECHPGNNVVDDGDVDDDSSGDDCDDDDDETTQVPSHTSTKPDAPTAAAAKSTQHVSKATSHTTAPPTQSTAISTTSLTKVQGGFITYFLQKGVAGACGTVHQDTDLICALDSARYDKGKFCGRQIVINANNRVTVTVADECPTCDNANSIDLSEGAFETIADLSVGILNATWTMLD